MNRLVIALVCGLAASCASPQPPPAASAGTASPSRTDQLERRIDALRRLHGVPVLHIDTDGDSRISEEEFTSYAQRAYASALAKIDQNGDGKISSDEYLAFKKGRQALFFKADMDQNGDEKISEEEFDKFHAARLAALVKVQDPSAMPSIDASQVAAQAKRRFAQLDANRDGQLDPTELPDTIEKPYYGAKGSFPKNQARSYDGWSHAGGWYYTGCDRPAPKPCWPVLFPTPNCSPWFGCYQGDGPDPSEPDDPADPCEEDPFGCDCVFSSSWPCSSW